MLTNTGFIVTDGNAIWGAGDTIISAIEDARDWIDISHTPELVENESRQKEHRMHGELFVAPATAKLVDVVLTDGTPDSWGCINGTHCTNAQESTYHYEND